jgi:hypothetical protein
VLSYPGESGNPGTSLQGEGVDFIGILSYGENELILKEKHD